VGWFPLGPRDPYFPGYHSSQGYFTRVNNTNTTINNTTINNYYNDSRNSNNTITNVKYVNQNVRNAVTAVPQNTFASGRPVAQNARAVPAAQLASAHYAVAPAIAPQQASVLGPKGGTAASAPRPPATAFSRPVVAPKCASPQFFGAHRRHEQSAARSAENWRRATRRASGEFFSWVARNAERSAAAGRYSAAVGKQSPQRASKQRQREA
jgi:hypothetical protein